MADRVAFTNSAAKRIARAVIAYEEGDRNGAGLNLGSSPAAVPPPLKLGTFTGNWQIGTYNTITITGTTNTVSVLNLCNSVLNIDEANLTTPRHVIFGNIRGTQSAVEIEMPDTLYLGTYTGDWQTGTYNTVTLHNSTSTASVYNWCTPAAGGDPSESRYVLFGSVIGTQSVLEIQLPTISCAPSLKLGTVDLTELPNFNASKVQLLGHDPINAENTCSGSLQWYDITTCATATA